ncbi:MAG: hypothetical protein L3J81_02440, partial [Thermoplasmata archaeon]|nr:hypothetical protein [Thermoplasmata archaeon]
HQHAGYESQELAHVQPEQYAALLQRAEEVAIDAGARQLYVTSAVGTRAYYRALGFERAGAHLAKPLFT